MAKYEGFNELIAEVARRLGSPLGEDDIRRAEDAGLLTDYAAVFDQADADELVRFFRPPVTAEAEGISPEAHWSEHSRQVMEGFREEQRATWALFGLRGPLALKELADLMTEHARHQPKVGDLSLLRYPTPVGPQVAYVYSGYFEDERISQVRECSGVSTPILGDTTLKELAQWDRCRIDSYKWASARATLMHRFLEVVERVTDATELAQDDVVGFLLCDLRVELPRFTCSMTYARGGANQGDKITLNIYDMHISPAEVQRVYRNARSKILSGELASPYTTKKRLCTPADKTTALIAFVRERRDRMKFPAIYHDWDKIHPYARKDEWAYASQRSMYNSYSAALVRWENKGKRERNVRRSDGASR